MGEGIMTQFPVTEAKVSYDHLTIRSTVDVLKAETLLDWKGFWVRVRDEEVMQRVAQAMLHAATAQLCRTSREEHDNPSFRAPDAVGL